jgi:hypothetical protein
MDFFIQKNATLPLLKMRLNANTDYIHEKFNEMLSNCAITFSMVDVSNKSYKIANKAGNLVVLENPNNPMIKEYYVTYAFNEKDTNKTGSFLGEFKFDFFGEYCGTLICPIKEKLYIHIQDSITKTTVHGG